MLVQAIELEFDDGTTGIVYTAPENVEKLLDALGIEDEVEVELTNMETRH